MTVSGQWLRQRRSASADRVTLDQPVVRRLRTWGCVAAVVVLAGWLAGQSGLIRPWVTPSSAGQTGVASAWLQPGVGSVDQPAPVPFKTGLEALPPSLQGTDVDGELPVDSSGHLRVVRGVRNCFDYFLSTVGEEPVQQVRERIKAYLRSQLKEPARGEAQALLERYLNYRASVEQLAQQGGGQSLAGVDALRRHLAQQLSLRQQLFNAAEHEAFFADEEVLGQYSIKAMQITQDTTLSARQKAERIHELNGTLPPSLQEAIGARERYEQLTAVTQQLSTEGAGPEALRAARVQIVGVEAADRLEALDAQRAQWQSRLQVFQTQRTSILKDPSLSEAQRQSALQQLAVRSFNDAERVRALALVDEAQR